MANPLYGQNKYDDASSKLSYNKAKSVLQVTGDVEGIKNRTQLMVDKAGAGALTLAANNVELTVANSGIITLVPAMTSAGPQTLELPACAGAVGCSWKFVLLATAAQDFDVITNGSEKILGAVSKGDGDNLAVSDANDSAGFDATGVIGSQFTITCISTTAGTAFVIHDQLDGLAANTAGINLK